MDVDPEKGRMTDTSRTYAICGEIRRMGESDDCIVRLAKKDGILVRFVPCCFALLLPKPDHSRLS